MGCVAYFDPDVYPSLAISSVARGYLYFRLPVASERVMSGSVDVVRNEWRDMKAVAGTGQTIGFGRWGYVGAIASLRPDTRSYTYDGGGGTLQVRAASEPPTGPVLYTTNAGIAKIAAAGTHAAIVKQLQDALK